MGLTMMLTNYQIIKATSNLDGSEVRREIHCLCSSVSRCLAELRRMYDAQWIGYPVIGKVLGNRILVVNTADSMIVYLIKAVQHASKRPPKKYMLMPKNGKACDARPYTNYGDALEEKIRLERLTGEKYIIAK